MRFALLAIALLLALPAMSQDFTGTVAAECKCNCQCPTIEQIRQVVREELARVTVTLKSSAGTTHNVEMPLATAGKPVRLSVPSDGGWYVTAVDGVPCSPRPVHTASGPAMSYEANGYEVRTMNYGGGFFGAARSSGQCFGPGCN